MNIKIVIEDKIATAPDNAVIVCGNNDYVITFLFDEDWDGYEAKTARFTYIKNGKSNYIDEPFTGDTCPVPMLSNISRVDIGVYAGDLRTTTAAVVKCKKSILCKGGTPDKPDEDVYGKIMELINKVLIDPNTPVDQIFNPESENPQSGKALKPVFAEIEKPITTEKISNDAVTVDKVSYNFVYDLLKFGISDDIRIVMPRIPGSKQGIVTANLANKLTEYKELATDKELYSAKAINEMIGGIENGSY